MHKVLVVGEMFSSNVGDAAIYEGLEHCLAELGTCSRALGILTPRDIENSLQSKPKESSLRSSVGVPQLVTEALAAGRRRITRSPSVRRGKNMYDFKRRHVEAIAHLQHQMEDVDGVLIGGGQLLTDQDFGLPPRIKAVVDAAHGLGKPVSFVGVGVSSDLGSSAKRIYKESLALAKSVGVRDSSSAEVVRELTSQRIYTHADLALAKPRPLGRVRSEEVGLNVMAPRYLEPSSRDRQGMWILGYVAAARTLLSEGFSVRLLTNGDREDHMAAIQVRDLLGANDEGSRRVSLARRPFSTIEVEDSLRGCDLVIASRMHAGLIAWSMGIPVLPLTWDQKIPAVWAKISPGLTVAPSAVLVDGTGIGPSLQSLESPSMGQIASARRSAFEAVRDVVVGL